LFWNLWSRLLSGVARTISSWNDCYMKKLFVVLGLGGIGILLIVFELNLLVSYLEKHRLPASFMDNGYNHETLETLRKHADEGMIYAEYRLGQKYFDGDGVQRDVSQAIAWFRRAADAGDLMSPYWLGMTYAFDDDVSKDSAESLRWLRIGADRGNADAQFALGSMFAYGNGVKKDLNEAVRWFRKAAVPSESKLDRVIFGKQLGSTAAQKALGMVYSYGYGVPKDAVEAAKWERMAASPIVVPPSDKYPNSDRLLAVGIPVSSFLPGEIQQTNIIPHSELFQVENRGFTSVSIRALASNGNHESQCDLGYQFANGDGVAKDPIEAVKWFRKAADGGYDQGEFRLGRCFAYGIGVQIDYDQSVKWLQLAADQGLLDARFELALRYFYGQGVGKNTEKGLSLLRSAAGDGYLPAQKILAVALEFGTLNLDRDIPVNRDYVESAKWFLVAAKTGDNEAQCSLGTFYENGWGVPKDPQLAIEWYKRSAGNNNQAALYNLATTYWVGKGVAKDSVEAAKWFRAAAELGMPDAEYHLGLMYSLADGVPKDGAEAAKWFKKCAVAYLESANRGGARMGDEIYDRLGAMYANGNGVTTDRAEAAKWFRKAADLGSPDAEYNLGVLSLKGDGIPMDKMQAAEWFRRAALSDRPDAVLVAPEAEYTLGLMYANGIGVSPNSSEAVQWLRNAAAQGHLQAQYNLGVIYATGAGMPKDIFEGIRWYREAANQGYGSAQYNLGMIYVTGDGVTKQPTEAANWLRKAAEQGNSDAQFQLGYLYDSLFKNIYLNGQADNGGLPFDDAEAFKWYLKAAKQGNVSAQFYLGAKYSFGRGVLQDDIEALAWLNIAAAAGNMQAAGAKFNLERKDGSAVAIAGQKRSKEILDEIEAAKKQAPGSVAVTGTTAAGPTDASPKASGSGAIVSRSGLVLTAAHVIIGANSVKVYTAQGLRGAKVVQIDEANDIAILQLDAGTYPALPIAASRRVRLGQTVATIGFPNIEIQGFSPKVTRGEISSLNGAGDDPRAWQISAPVQPGNSGGPLLDENGNLIGVVVSKLSIEAAKATNDIPQNVNYAVKSTYALALLEPYLKNDVPEANQSVSVPRFEDMVARAQQSAVLILVY
jgi:TPR repeat protein